MYFHFYLGVSLFILGVLTYLLCLRNVTFLSSVVIGAAAAVTCTQIDHTKTKVDAIVGNEVFALLQQSMSEPYRTVEFHSRELRVEEECVNIVKFLHGNESPGLDDSENVRHVKIWGR